MNSQYTAEAKARFGATDPYKEFENKTAAYTKDNWQSAEIGLNKIFAKFAECKSEGHTPNSAKAQTLVKELQNFITQNFYTCTDEILKGLGAMYVADGRFKASINKHSSGTADFISKAIEIY